MDQRTTLAALLQPTVDALGFSLWGIEFLPQGKHSVLRVYIDHENGIKIEDCEKVSRQISAVLNVEDPINGQYALEVSSPGIDRPLFVPEQYQNFCGERILVRVRAAIEGKRKWLGVLKEVNGSGIVLDVEAQLITIDFSEIDKANVKPEF